MKFDKKYPNTKTWEEARMCLCKADQNRECFECGELTTWFDLNFQVHICSDECYNKLSDEYNDACKGGET